MRRLSGMVLAGAMLMLPAFSLTGSAQDAAKPAAPTKNTYRPVARSSPRLNGPAGPPEFRW